MTISFADAPAAAPHLARPATAADLLAADLLAPAPPISAVIRAAAQGQNLSPRILRDLGRLRGGVERHLHLSCDFASKANDARDFDEDEGRSRSDGE